MTKLCKSLISQKLKHKYNVISSRNDEFYVKHDIIKLELANLVLEQHKIGIEDIVRQLETQPHEVITNNLVVVLFLCNIYT